MNNAIQQWRLHNLCLFSKKQKQLSSSHVTAKAIYSRLHKELLCFSSMQVGKTNRVRKLLLCKPVIFLQNLSIMYIFIEHSFWRLKKTSYFNSSLAKIFIKYSYTVGSVEKLFPLWLHKAPAYGRTSLFCGPKPAGLFFLLYFYLIWSKPLYLFQASWASWSFPTWQ